MATYARGSVSMAVTVGEEECGETPARPRTAARRGLREPLWRGGDPATTATGTSLAVAPCPQALTPAFQVAVGPHPPPCSLRVSSSSHLPGVLPARHGPRRCPHPVHPRVCVRGQRGGHLPQRRRAWAYCTPLPAGPAANVAVVRTFQLVRLVRAVRGWCTGR